MRVEDSVFPMKTNIVVVGGAGHVGLPLSLVLAKAGYRVGIFDISAKAVDQVVNGRLPFFEPGAEALLQSQLSSGRLSAGTEPQIISSAEVVIVVVGTPVGETGPDPNLVLDTMEGYRRFFSNGQLVVLRSTLFPGVTEQLSRAFENWGLNVDVAFAPERIAEHKALEELEALPQIVAGCSPRATERTSKLFESLGVQVLVLEPKEAELAKLYSNAWRYLRFAIANQFFQIADNEGLDFEKIRRVMSFEYPRAADLPSAGFAAGPCLLKDTLQLAAFAKNQFTLGVAAVQTNEGLTSYVIEKLRSEFDLASLTVGLLGMSFKGGSDDIRSSLAYKLKRELRFHAKAVFTTDPMVSNEVDPSLLSLNEVLELADILIISAPHPEYKRVITGKPVVDIWGLTRPVTG